MEGAGLKFSGIIGLFCFCRSTNSIGSFDLDGAPFLVLGAPPGHKPNFQSRMTISISSEVSLKPPDDGIAWTIAKRPNPTCSKPNF
jgi:hypothetical protein